MGESLPFDNDAWRERVHLETESGLSRVGRPPSGPVEVMKSWARSHLLRVPTEAGPVWVKLGYRLPPGEEVVLERLAERWPARVPRLVATWPGAVAMETIAAPELTAEDPPEAWERAALELGRLTAGETDHAEEWRLLGVRDRRPAAWGSALESFVAGSVYAALDPSLRARFEGWLPDFIDRYQKAFAAPPTLVPQDSGCCNIGLGKDGPIFYDWADVVVGHATFSCDRLLDQVPAELRDRVIAAFLAESRFGLEEFRAMRRSNVLHEVLRYHDEIEWIAEGNPTRESLARSVGSQLEVLLDHEDQRDGRTTPMDR
ncbi:MAG: hypothetical protein AAF488_03875 [Planctomycetota bacterium]